MALLSKLPLDEFQARTTAAKGRHVLLTEILGSSPEGEPNPLRSATCGTVLATSVQNVVSVPGFSRRKLIRISQKPQCFGGICNRENAEDSVAQVALPYAASLPDVTPIQRLRDFCN